MTQVLIADVEHFHPLFVVHFLVERSSTSTTQFLLHFIEGMWSESAYCKMISVRKCMRIWDIIRICAHNLYFALIWEIPSVGSTSSASPTPKMDCIAFKIMRIYNYRYKQ